MIPTVNTKELQLKESIKTIAWSDDNLFLGLKDILLQRKIAAREYIILEDNDSRKNQLKDYILYSNEFIKIYLSIVDYNEV